MHTKAKYIRTAGNDIIIFPQTMLHNEFIGYNPVSAGFIEFYQRRDGSGIDCWCYGESTSLRLKADPKMDEFLVRSSILGIDMLEYKPGK